MWMQSFSRFFLATASMAALLLVSSCTVLPSSGPSADAIQSGSKASETPYVLVNVTQAVADMLAQDQARPLSVAFGSTKKTSSSRIGVGDVVVTVPNGERRPPGDRHRLDEATGAGLGIVEVDELVAQPVDRGVQGR